MPFTIRFGRRNFDFGFSVLIPVRTRRRSIGTPPGVSQSGIAAQRDAAARRLPVPNPAPRSVPYPFPTGPAANDPIFRKGIGRAFGLQGAILSVLLELGAKIILEEQARQAEKKRAAQEQELEKLKQKRADQAPQREVKIPENATIPRPNLPPLPGRITLPRPGKAPIPDRPRPDLIPNFPVGIPFPVGVPKPVVVPSIPTPKLPSPQTTPQPSPQPMPSSFPQEIVSPQSRPFPSPFFNPLTYPQSQPRPGTVVNPTPLGDLFPQPSLTPGNPTALGFIDDSALQNPLANPQTQSDKCEIVQRRKRKKGKCREGFFRESATGTKYTTWRETNCAKSTLRSIT